MYSEDLNFASNKDMGSKDFFEMACSNPADVPNRMKIAGPMQQEAAKNEANTVP